MKVILLKDIKGVGRKFEEKNVSDGYATNQLIPKKLAVPASEAGNVKTMIQNKLAHDQAEKNRVDSMIEKINGTEIRLKLKANEKNSLFASLTAQKLSDILKSEKGIEIDAELIDLKSPIKQIGTFEVPIKLGNKSGAKFMLVVERV